MVPSHNWPVGNPCTENDPGRTQEEETGRDVMSIRRRLFAVAAVLSLSSAFGTIAPISVQAETVLNRGFGASPHTLDPHINFGAREAWIQDDLYEGLVSTAADGKVIPGAAESWDVSDDGRTITFHLRPNLKWSNGEPLVAQDFVNGM